MNSTLSKFDRVEANSYAECMAEEHHTTHGVRKTEIKADDHLTVGTSQHVKLGTGQFIKAGNEIHYYAGDKIVIDAGMELTAKGGGSFLKLDPSGVTLSGPVIKINSGGAVGRGSGIGIQLPTIPGAIDLAAAGAVMLTAQANDLSRLKAAARDNLLLSSQCHRQPDGGCPLEACPCRTA